MTAGKHRADRRVAGHRHKVRALTSEEGDRLLKLREAMSRALREFDDCIVSLYEDNVTQHSIAALLQVTQSAVQLRIRRHYDRLPPDPVPRTPSTKTQTSEA